MKAVFDTKPDSAYDDDVTQRYHFPPRYAGIVSNCVGDWIVLRRPRAGGGSKAYFGVGYIARIEPDMAMNGYSYAIISDYLAFDHPVPWIQSGRYFEESLRNLTNIPQLGLYLRGKSVRALSNSDFADILAAGLGDAIDPGSQAWLERDPLPLDPVVSSLLEGTVEERKRRIVEILVNRKVRDVCFRRSVCKAYDYRCAFTGLKIADNAGRAEVQAAHIWPVAEGGPDTIQNGIALSATVHWLFDRHLISIADDYSLLIAYDSIPNELATLFEKHTPRIVLPSNRQFWPHPTYIARHRKVFLESLR